MSVDLAVCCSMQVSVGSEAVGPMSVTGQDTPTLTSGLGSNASLNTTLSALNTQDDSSNDGLLIVDEPSPSPAAPPTPKTRGRGRPRGSGTGRGRPRGRGGTKKALSAAEIAGAQAGMTAAYAAYGYNITGSKLYIIMFFLIGACFFRQVH